MAKKQSKIWRAIDNIKGDKVVLMIVITLIMFSIVSIFASSSLLALQQGTTRLAIFEEQIKIVCLGALFIFLIYKIPYIWVFRVLSQLGFILSAGLLACLILRIGTTEFNDAVRALSIGGLQIHVYEIVKVAMVMYLAWAVHTYKLDDFKILNWMARKFPKQKWLKKPITKQFIYIFAPIIVIVLCIAAGSLSSACFIGLIMIVTIMIGGIKFKDMIAPALIGLISVLIVVSLHAISPKKILPRMNTWKSRLEHVSYEDTIKVYGIASEKGQQALDKLRQPESAMVAIKESKFIGKGPGKSTQKHVVSVMYGDYMFSYIIEEFGILGAFIIIALYVSLLARGSIIVRSCNSTFAQTAIAGLTILISGQAMLHMLINVQLWPVTGQTLPMISHGNSSFLCFSIAFGIILSISKIAKKNIDKQSKAAMPLMSVEENVEATLNELDDFDTIE